jgi:type II secretory pathway component PulC
MIKLRKIYFWIILIAAVVVIAGAYFYFWQPEIQGTEFNATAKQAKDIGISYVIITQASSSFYNAGVESGAIITEVYKDSLADIAGLKIGDVIVSFNGTELSDDTPFLGMLRNCSYENNIQIEICRNSKLQSVELGYGLNWNNSD